MSRPLLLCKEGNAALGKSSSINSHLHRALLQLLFILFLSAAPILAQSTATPAVTAAVAELNKGNVLEAVKQLKEVVRAEPSSDAAYFYLSTVYTSFGHNDTAYRYLESAMKANPRRGAYYHQLGVIRSREGCRPEALEAFHQALQRGVGQDESLAWRHVGDVYLDLLASEKAIEAYQNAIKFDPNDAAAHLALGKLYLDRNNPDRAILELTAALKLSPDLDGVHATLGRAWRAKGDPITAINMLKQGVERNPSDQGARYVLGQTLLSLGRTDEGRREMDEYRRVQERISQTNSLFESAVQRAQAGELDRAENLLKETLLLAPQYAAALRVLGAVLLNKGNTQRAQEVLQQALASNPLNPETYFDMATAYFRSGNLSEALEMAGRAVIVEEEDARYYSLLADIYSKMERPSEARTALERAAQLKSRPDHQTPHPYSAEMRRRADSATVKAICGSQR
jgi:tetratricopeptide (TPR) repeat protein